MDFHAHKSVLVVAAHPDDEVIGVGGTIARHVAHGHDVHLAMLTEGASVQFPGDTSKIHLKKQQVESAAKLLGIKRVFFAEHSDQKLDTLPILQLNQFVEHVARTVGAQIVYTHHYADLNNDHRLAFSATTVAVRPFALQSFEKLLCYCVDTLSHHGHGIPRSNVFVDISDFLERKLEAMEIYETEVRDYPHPRSTEALRQIAMSNGVRIGMRMAEVFELVLSVGK